MSAKRTALKLSTSSKTAALEPQYTVHTVFSTNPGIINFSISVIYTVCLFAIITLLLAGALLMNVHFAQTFEENKKQHVNYTHYAVYLAVLVPITVGLIAYGVVKRKYAYDKLYIMTVTPMILVCINYAAHYFNLTYVLHNDSFEMNFLPLQYIEWTLTSSIILLVLAHIPSVKPQIQEVNPIANKVESDEKQNKQTPVTNRYKKERRTKTDKDGKEGDDEDEEDDKTKLQVPIYSVLQLNLITFGTGAMSQMLREEFKKYTLAGSCFTGLATIFFVYRFMCDRFVPSRVTKFISYWFIAVWCWYPTVFFITRVLSSKQNNTLEHDLYFVGDLIGKTTLAVLCSQMSTRTLISNKTRTKRSE